MIKCFSTVTALALIASYVPLPPLSPHLPSSTHTQPHLEECPKLPMTCERCQEELKREEVASVCVCANKYQLVRISTPCYY